MAISLGYFQIYIQEALFSVLVLYYRRPYCHEISQSELCDSSIWRAMFTRTPSDVPAVRSPIPRTVPSQWENGYIWLVVFHTSVNFVIDISRT